uniref:ATP binding protein n=1 Tax=Solanum tuberosum TaxID=4113 RepID=M1DGH9_SOLTU
MRLKLADFGLSLKSTDRSKKHDHFRGTLVYASPESVTRGVVYGKEVDIWSLGCIVVEMITGKRIWSGYKSKSKNELALKITRLEPEIPYNISNDAKDFLRKCLERDSGQRWTAEMLLNHPFIKNINAKNMKNGLIHKCNWISTKHLFSTISPYYPNHNSSCSRGSSSNISSLETKNYKVHHTTDHEESVLGFWDLISFLFG